MSDNCACKSNYIKKIKDKIGVEGKLTKIQKHILNEIIDIFESSSAYLEITPSKYNLDMYEVFVLIKSYFDKLEIDMNNTKIEYEKKELIITLNSREYKNFVRFLKY